MLPPGVFVHLDRDLAEEERIKSGAAPGTQGIKSGAAPGPQGSCVDGFLQRLALCLRPGLQREIRKGKRTYRVPFKLEIEGRPFTVQDVLGDGFFGVAYKAVGGDGACCVKQVFTMEESFKERPATFDPEKAAADTKKQLREFTLEVRLNKALFEAVARLPPDAGSCRVPRVLAHHERYAALEFVDGQDFQSWLRVPRAHTAKNWKAVAEQVRAVSWVVLRKVCVLLQATRKMGFNHRDCQDNNVMLKVRRRPVRTCEDVDVWLIDFGKSMANVDGEGLFAFTQEKDSVYNPTTDVLRFVYS
eukprot:185495-Prymnesium_polylepis.1